MSFAGVPIRNATGANTHEKTVDSVSPVDTLPSTASTNAMMARNAISIAATFNASCRPSAAPADAASMTLTCCRSTDKPIAPPVSGDSVSGSSSFDRYRPHGAAITLVVRIAMGSAPMPMYTAITPPEIVAMPPTISASSSDWVIRGTYGLTISGASVCPMNTLAAADSVSAPLVPSTYIMARAITHTTNCRMPK